MQMFWVFSSFINQKMSFKHTCNHSRTVFKYTYNYLSSNIRAICHTCDLSFKHTYNLSSKHKYMKRIDFSPITAEGVETWSSDRKGEQSRAVCTVRDVCTRSLSCCIWTTKKAIQCVCNLITLKDLPIVMQPPYETQQLWKAKARERDKMYPVIKTYLHKTDETDFPAILCKTFQSHRKDTFWNIRFR